MSLFSSLLDWISNGLLIAGVVVILIGTIGVWRLPDVFTRLHAASVQDTLGAGLVLLSLILKAGLGILSFKLLLIYVFLLFSSPVASHALARTAVKDGLVPWGVPEGLFKNTKLVKPVGKGRDKARRGNQSSQAQSKVKPKAKSDPEADRG